MIDQVTIETRGGAGGNGAVSFRREKFVPLGGPDGGAGGRGGHVIVVARTQPNTLNRYRRQRIFQAEDGRHGASKKRRGRDGEDLILEVPTGTVVVALGERGKPDGQLSDLDEDGAGILIAQGGRGGCGNTFFKSASNRAPRIAQRGHRGAVMRALLELRLIADVGLVGLPNAGKSTLLRRLSAARPRVGAYPFTTLEPNLGVAAVGWEEFVLADLPGLTEGASAGAGLGHAFLRHVSRTRLVVHLLDGSGEAPLAAHDSINRELAAYSDEMARKPQIVVINKIDRADVAARQDELAAAFAARGVTPLFLSALSGEGAEALAKRCLRDLRDQRAREAAQPRELSVLRPPAKRRRFSIEREGTGIFRVRGERLEAFVEMMDLDDVEARQEVHRWLDRRGVGAALRKAGVQPGHAVRVGEAEWLWES